jgi:hypothetical protein
MKTNHKYIALSLVTMLTVTGVSVGALSFAQTVTTLSCSVGAASVIANQPAIITATGGNGSYSWSGTNLAVTNSAGSQFAVSYPNPGTYPITVMSGSQTATCNVTVVAASATGGLTCFPVTQNVALGQTATVSASGGNGNYIWSSPDISVSNPTGAGFSVNYGSIGAKTLTVTSGGLTTTCVVNVLANGVTTVPITTPGLPNTGGGYNQ